MSDDSELMLERARDVVKNLMSDNGSYVRDHAYYDGFAGGPWFLDDLRDALGMDRPAEDDG